MQVVVDGILTSYKKVGKGSNIILCLHGWADSSKSFEKISTYLSKDYSVISVDLPGFGATQSPKKPWDLLDYAKFVSSFLSKIDVKPEIIVGHSNGGAIAIKAISEGLIEPKNTVLIASSGVRSKNSGRKKIYKSLSKPAKIMISPLPKSLKGKIKKYSYDKIGSDYMISPEMKETFKNIVSHDVVSESKKVKVPTLLIYGDQDEATPVEYGRILSESISKSRLEIIKDAGHFVHQEQPERLAKMIRGFSI